MGVFGGTSINNTTQNVKI